MRISPLVTFGSLKTNSQKNIHIPNISFWGNYNPVQEALKDSGTGQVDKTVDWLIKMVLKLEKMLGASYQVSTGRKDEDLIDFIEALKNEKGEFSKQNIKCAKKLLALSLVPNKYGVQVDFCDIALILNFCKRDDGIFDETLFGSVFQYAKKDKSYSLVARGICPIFGCSVDDKNKLIKLFLNPVFDGNLNSNFYNFAKFCVNEDFELIPENVKFIESLTKLPKANYSRNYLEIVKRYPHEREYLLELAKNPNFKTDQKFNDDFIFYMQDENENISDADKQRLTYFITINQNLDEFSKLFSRCCVYEDGKRVGFNDELFNRVSQIAPILNNGEFSALNTRILADLIENKIDLQQIGFKEKKNLLDDIRKMQITMNDESFFEDIVQAIQNSITPNIRPLEVSNESKLNFIKNILFSDSKFFTPFEEALVSNIHTMKNMSSGFKLRYTRQEFMADLAKIAGDDFNAYCVKLNISPVNNSSYNGIIQLHNLDCNVAKDKEVFDLAYEFMYKNSFESDNVSLNQHLNILIKAMPEFINVVDKKQHVNQNHTLDVHILLTLAYALQNPDYFDKLTSLDRAVLKFAILFHDLSKQEGVVDSAHPQVSANWVKSISSKIFKTNDVQNRIFEFVNNHHWTKEFNIANKSKKLIDSLAFKFRRPNDFEMAKIMAQADMKAVSEVIYQAYGSCLEDAGIKNIEDSINFYNSIGSVINSHFIVSPNKMKKHIIEYQGKSFPLINLAELPEEASVDEFGFSYGLKKRDLRLLVHMIPEQNLANNLNTAKYLTNPINAGILSDSLVDLSDRNTYKGRKYGLLLKASNFDVVAMSSSIIGSGVKKDFDRLIYLVFNQMSEVEKGDFRDRFIRNLGKKYENVKNADYSIFYKKYLSNLTSFSQINPQARYEIGRYEIFGDTLIEIIKKTIDEYVLFGGDSPNEIITYTPDLNGIVVKASSIDEVSQEIIDFASKNDLPVILI